MIPGMTVFICASITRVCLALRPATSSRLPIRVMRLPVMASASARGRAPSMVRMRALVIRMSAAVMAGPCDWGPKMPA